MRQKKNHFEKRFEADESQFKASCEVDKARSKPVMRMKKPKRTQKRGTEI